MNAFRPEELVAAIDEAKSHLINRVIFWPKLWREFNAPLGMDWDWKTVPFQKSSTRTVPNDQRGVYSFVICPNVALHPRNHFVVYVGKADQSSLRARFQDYFQQMQRTKRPAISYVLNKYMGYVEFCFCPIEDRGSIQEAENSLLQALLPPYNTEFPGAVDKIIRGLR